MVNCVNFGISGSIGNAFINAVPIYGLVNNMKKSRANAITHGYRIGMTENQIQDEAKRALAGKLATRSLAYAGIGAGALSALGNPVIGANVASLGVLPDMIHAYHTGDKFQDNVDEIADDIFRSNKKITNYRKLRGLTKKYLYNNDFDSLHKIATSDRDI